VRFVAIDVAAPRRIATLAARHDKVLPVNFVAHFGATTQLLLPKMFNLTQRQFIRPRSDASVQHRTHYPDDDEIYDSHGFVAELRH
jgi:hypothetical protein